MTQTDAINELAKLLDGKYRKGVLVNKNEDHVIFNVCTQLKLEDIERVLERSFVVRDETRFYCNQYSLVFEVGLNLNGREEVGGKTKSNALNWVSLREYAASESFEPPPINSCIGYIPPAVYEALTGLLEIVHFVLFTAKIDFSESLYQTKTPYYNVIVQLASNQTLKVDPLITVKQLCLDTVKIKSIALVFDKGSNAMKLIMRVQVRV